MKKSLDVARIAGFLLSAIIGAGAFGAFAAWAVSTLDPAAQEAIGLASSPWLVASERPNSVRFGLGTVEGCGAQQAPVGGTVVTALRR